MNENKTADRLYTNTKNYAQLYIMKNILTSLSSFNNYIIISALLLFCTFSSFTIIPENAKSSVTEVAKTTVSIEIKNLNISQSDIEVVFLLNENQRYVQSLYVGKEKTIKLKLDVPVGKVTSLKILSVYRDIYTSSEAVDFEKAELTILN